MSIATAYPAPQLLPTQRPVRQPRIAVFAEAITFQVYVNLSDASRQPGQRKFPLDYLRDEYISTYGNDHGGVFL